MMSPFKKILKQIDAQPLIDWSCGVCYAASELNMRSFGDQFVELFKPNPPRDIFGYNQVSGYFFYREDGTFNTKKVSHKVLRLRRQIALDFAHYMWKDGQFE